MNSITDVDELSFFETALVLRDAAATKRYHTHRTLRQQNLAEHSYGVIMLAMQIAPDQISGEFCRAVALHDLPEYITGDIPAPTKRASSTMRDALDDMERATGPLYYDTSKLNLGQQRLLKFCDTMELVLWCLEEVQMGNLYCCGIVANGLRWTRVNLDNHPSVDYLDNMEALWAGAHKTATDLKIKVF